MGANNQAARYSYNYNGKALNMTITEWVNYLKNEPTHDHIHATTMRERFKCKEHTRFTIAQCLGVDAVIHRSTKKTVNALVQKTDMAEFLMVNKFLRKGLG